MIPSFSPIETIPAPVIAEYPTIALFERHMGLSFDDVDRKIASLTAREAQVLERIAAGDDTTEIIRYLDIAYSTLATHRKRLAYKFGVSTNGSYAKIYWFHRLCAACQPGASAAQSDEGRGGYLSSDVDVRPETEALGITGDRIVAEGAQPGAPQVMRGN